MLVDPKIAMRKYFGTITSFVLPMFDVPRKKDGAHRDDAGDKDHRQADAIDREMIIHPEHWHPRDADNRGELRKIDNWRLE